MERAPHPCPWPGCPELTTDLRGCDIHRPATKTAARGYDAEWKRFAAAYLLRHRRCRKCGGRAHHVDHKIPLRAGGAKYDPLNLQPLCARCHGRKTLTETTEARDLNRPYR